MTDTPNRSTATTARRPDCVTEVRRGNTVLVVSGYFKQDTTATAADKMMKVLEAESAAGEQSPMPCKATFPTEIHSTLCAIK